MALRDRLHDPTVQRWLKLAVFAALLVFALWAPFYFAPFRVFQFTRVLIFAMAVLGLGLLTGFNGQISLGHGAFFAIGAYTAAVLVAKSGWPFLLVVPPALLITFALGYGVGIPALRLHGLYLALVTLALAVVTPPILKRFDSITGGSMGLTVPKPATPAWTGLERDQFLYFLALIAAVVLFVLARNLVNSRTGRAMIAIREDPLAAETMGVHLARVKTLTFAWSAMFAGLAGVVFTWTIGYVSPESFTIVLSIELLAGLVVGGLGSIWGALVGAVFLVFIPNVSQDINQAAPGIAFGALLIIAMYLFPGGVAGVARRSWARLLRAPTPAAGPARRAATDDLATDGTASGDQVGDQADDQADEPVGTPGHSEEGAP